MRTGGLYSSKLSLRPSMEMRKLWLRLRTRSVISALSRMMTGRVLRLWEATGEMQNMSEPGTMTGPPTLSE